MEPKDFNSNETNTSPKNSDKKSTLITILLPVLTVLVTIVIFTLIYVATTKTVAPEPVMEVPLPEVVVEENQVAEASGERFYSNTLNKSFVIPEGWVPVELNASKIPLGVENAKLTFKNEERNCVIATASLDRSAADYKQTSFGNRLFSSIAQYDGNWFTNQSYHEKKIQFSDRNRQYLSYEILVYQGYLLWNEDNESVARECVTDFEDLIKSEQHHYLAFDYKNYIQGFYSVTRLEHRNVSPNEYLPATYKLLFTVDNQNTAQNGNTYEVIDLPSSVNSQKIYVQGSEIYFVAEAEGEYPYDGEFDAFYKYNLEEAAFSRVYEHKPTFEGDGKIMSYLFTNDGGLFYLSGCGGGYRVKCQAALHYVNLNDVSDHQVLVASTSAHSIMGQTSDGTIYMEYAFGDGGCGSTQFHTYKDGVYEVLPKIGGCADTPEYNAFIATRNEVRDSLIANPTSPYIEHRMGSDKFAPGESEASYPNNKFIFLD